ncbi:MAG: hypothetical protein WC654_08525 [Patescibacteria group bacterium]
MFTGPPTIPIRLPTHDEICTCVLEFIGKNGPICDDNVDTMIKTFAGYTITVAQIERALADLIKAARIVPKIHNFRSLRLELY